MCITSIRYYYGPQKKKPKVGDEKVVKGVTMVRRHKRVPKGHQYEGAYIYSSGRPCYEWVPKDPQ